MAGCFAAEPVASVDVLLSMALVVAVALVAPFAAAVVAAATTAAVACTAIERHVAGNSRQSAPERIAGILVARN